MMTSRTAEIWVGLFIAAGMAALFVLAMKVSNLSVYTNDEGYEVTARFQNASGLKERSAVTMAGVRIGRVTEIGFDEKTFEAVVHMQIQQQYDTLPDDTAANIYTAGLLGEKYIGLEPGPGSNPCEDEILRAELEGRKPDVDPEDCKPQYLSDGAVIKKTQGSLVLEKLIAQFVANFMNEGGGNDSPQNTDQ